MKVLVISNMYPGKNSYLGTFIKQQVEDMENEGLRTTKVVKDRNGYFAYAPFILKNIFYLLLGSYDIVHAYYGFHSALFAAIIKRRPLIITFVGSDALIEPSRNKVYRILQKFVVSRSDHIIAVSSKIKNVLVSDLGADSNKISVITFGIDFDLFKPSPQDKVREKLGFPSDMKLVLFPSNPRRIEKRFDIFNRAVELVREENQNILPVILSNNRRPYSEVPLVMNACDVLVLTSDSEGSPTVIKEALACNLPVVSVDVGDAREVIKDAANCYVCKQEPGDIAESIKLVLHKNTRAAARDNIKHLSSKTIATKIIEVYTQITQGSL
ncbi:MAG: glycosyltransferase [Elusimicrobiota bacterium]|nr:glycosyltransferase [Elusimicrobiota bacterium]MDH5661765.1 glycosyltransferase [Elusimicrobiota bacterium]